MATKATLTDFDIAVQLFVGGASLPNVINQGIPKDIAEKALIHTCTNPELKAALAEEKSAPQTIGTPATYRARVTMASDVQIVRQKMLDERDAIPLGAPSIFAGVGGVGKSTVVTHKVAQLSRGELRGEYIGQPQTTLWVGIEDDPARVMVPRLKAAGADLTRVGFLAAEKTLDTKTEQWTPKLPLDIDFYRSALTDTGAKLLVLDPASSLMEGDLNRREDVRQSLDPLSDLAQELELAIILITHFGKGRGVASEKISGSHAWRDVARCVILCARDEPTGQTITTLDKSNYSAEIGHSRAYEITDVLVETDDGEIMHVGCAIDRGTSDINVGDIINREAVTEEEAATRNEAQDWLIDYMKNQPAYEAAAADVIKAGQAAGFTRDDIRNARRRCKEPQVITKKASFGGGWVWIAEYDTTNSKEGVTEDA